MTIANCPFAFHAACNINSKLGHDRSDGGMSVCHSPLAMVQPRRLMAIGQIKEQNLYNSVDPRSTGRLARLAVPPSSFTSASLRVALRFSSRKTVLPSASPPAATSQSLEESFVLFFEYRFVDCAEQSGDLASRSPSPGSRCAACRRFPPRPSCFSLLL